MPPKARSNQLTGHTTEAFLRSINLRYDAECPERIGHFRPTSKCVPLCRRLLGLEADRAFLIVAPYGSGKSLTATYLLHLLENRTASRETLKRIERPLKEVSPELAQWAASRYRRKKTYGLAVALHGHYPSVAKGLRDAALEAMSRRHLGRESRPLQDLPCETIEQAVDFLGELNGRLATKGLDRVTILWDEFARHLESLTSEGRASELSDVQVIAEYAARSPNVPMTLGLFLHQGFMHYAGKLPQTVRNEWAKIEGRFETIQYVDDSLETYRLVADLVANQTSRRPPTLEVARRLASSCARHELFRDFTKKGLVESLRAAYPIDPVAYYLLPRVSARVAQNERTLFTFLFSTDLSGRVGVDTLYDYFAPTMRSDTAVGGTHKQWLETESALTKVTDDEAAQTALKTACLLGLGASGERSRAKRSLLELAVSGYEKPTQAKKVVDRLISKKLLLHRKHNDEVSVWHGTDADLRGRLEEEMRRRRADFDLVAFLRQHVPAPAWRPNEYNDEYGVRRYFAGQYFSTEQFAAKLSMPQASSGIVPDDADGRVLYLLAETPEAVKAALAAAAKTTADRAIVAVPSEPLALTEAALEIFCLLQMQLDAELLEADPLITPELAQMVDDARAHLQRVLDRLIRPSSRGPKWFYLGKQLAIHTTRDLRRGLSRIASEVYPLTPKIRNEMVVRRKPTSVVINARRKLLLAILERHGQENLGIEGDFPDSSIFRTVLLHTGLYRKTRHGTWNYASPKSVKDPGLRKVWDKVRDFFTVPSADPKHPVTLIGELKAPPYGLRAGLLPVLIGAGIKAFPSAISLTRRGAYVTDILPPVVEELCADPESFRLSVLDLDEDRAKYLRKVHRLFASVSTYEPAEADVIRLCFDAIEAWKTQLPPAAFTSRRLSTRTTRLQAALQRESDPVQFLLRAIPEACEAPLASGGRLLQRLKSCRDELEGVAHAYAEEAAAEILQALVGGHNREDSDLRETAKKWASCFPDEFVENLKDQVSKGLLLRMQMPYDSDEGLVNSLASLLVGRLVGRWDDSTVVAFGRAVHDVVHRVEEHALVSGAALLNDSRATEGLAQLLTSRIAELCARLTTLLGPEAAEHRLEALVGTAVEEEL